jgi:hypothetical protein
MLFASTAFAQPVPTRRINDPSAAGPVLRLSQVLRLGSLEGEHDAFGRVMDVALDRSGRVLVADDQSHDVRVFDARGRYVGTLGRQGRGPGEFQSPWQVAADAQDSIWVWDSGLARISVFSPSLRFARSFQIPPEWVVNSLRFLPDGRVLLAAYGRSTRGSLHLFSRAGRFQRSFGPVFNAPDLSGYESSLLGGSVDVTSNSIVYSTKSPYEIWIFDLNGAPRQKCAGNAAWTTSPTAVVETTDAAAQLRWNRYVHSSAVLDLGGGLLLNQVLDPSGDRTVFDVLTSDCRLLRRTQAPSAVMLGDRRGTRLAAIRNLEYPEVIIYEQRMAPR